MQASNMPSNWQHELWFVACIAILAGIAGSLSGQPMPLLGLAFVTYLGWHLYQLIRLSRWLRSGKSLHPPFPFGLWSNVFEGFHRLQVHTRKRKRRQSRFFRRFREAAAAFPDAAVILGREGTIEWCNPAGRSLLGLSWPQQPGERLAEQIRQPTLEEYLRAGDFTHPIEIPSPTNKTRILSLVVRPFGKKHQSLVVARDITESYHVDQIQRDFLANASHELRTPLTVILGLLGTTGPLGGEDPDAARSLELMQQQAQRMQDIIADLLLLSRIEMDQPTTPQELVPVPALLASILEDARVLIVDTEHVPQLEAEPGIWLRGNAAELRSAFANLIFNAIQHTPGRAEIHIRWQADASGASLTVSDTGEGIAARHLPRLTERFYRVDRGRSRQAGGTGLGLAIVKHVLGRHNAKLHIASEVGKGSDFTCRFPDTRVVRTVVRNAG